MKSKLLGWLLGGLLVGASVAVSVGILVGLLTGARSSLIDRYSASCMDYGEMMGVETRYMPDWGCYQRVQSGDWERVMP